MITTTTNGTVTSPGGTGVDRSDRLPGGSARIISQDVAMSYLLQSITDNTGMQVLVGPPGSGKTHVLIALSRAAPQHFTMIYCNADQLDFDQLLNALCGDLQLSPAQANRPQKLKALKAHFEQCAQHGIASVLLIDNAHLMDRSTLQHLLTFYQNVYKDGQGLRLVLSGRPQLVEQLMVRPTLHQAVSKAVFWQLESPPGTEPVPVPMPVSTDADPQQQQIPWSQGLLTAAAALVVSAGLGAFFLTVLHNDDRTTTAPASRIATTEATTNSTAAASRIGENNATPSLSLSSTNTNRTAATTATPKATAAEPEAIPSTTAKTVSNTTPAISAAAPASYDRVPSTPTSSPQPPPRTPATSRFAGHSAAPTPTTTPNTTPSIAGSRLNINTDSVATAASPATRQPATEAVKLPIKPPQPTAPQLTEKSAQQAVLTVAARSASAPAPAPAVNRESATEPEPTPRPSPVAIAVIEPALKPAAEPTAPTTTVAPAKSAEPASVIAAADYRQRGEALLDLGDIASARLLFEACAEAGSSVCLEALGATYDPLQLNERGAIGVYADPQQAIDYYQRAVQLGATSAQAPLERLSAWLNTGERSNNER